MSQKHAAAWSTTARIYRHSNRPSRRSWARFECLDLTRWLFNLFDSGAAPNRKDSVGTSHIHPVSISHGCGKGHQKLCKGLRQNSSQAEVAK